MKIAIIEDEQVHTDLLAAYIQSWSKEKKIPINVHSFPDASSPCLNPLCQISDPLELFWLGSKMPQV